MMHSVFRYISDITVVETIPAEETAVNEAILEIVKDHKPMEITMKMPEETVQETGQPDVFIVEETTELEVTTQTQVKEERAEVDFVPEKPEEITVTIDQLTVTKAPTVVPEKPEETAVTVEMVTVTETLITKEAPRENVEEVAETIREDAGTTVFDHIVESDLPEEKVVPLETAFAAASGVPEQFVSPVSADQVVYGDISHEKPLLPFDTVTETLVEMECGISHPVDVSLGETDTIRIQTVDVASDETVPKQAKPEYIADMTVVQSVPAEETILTQTEVAVVTEEKPVEVVMTAPEEKPAEVVQKFVTEETTELLVDADTAIAEEIFVTEVPRNAFRILYLCSFSCFRKRNLLQNT